MPVKTKPLKVRMKFIGGVEAKQRLVDVLNIILPEEKIIEKLRRLNKRNKMKGGDKK